jgi:hypothetical protein
MENRLGTGLFLLAAALVAGCPTWSDGGSGVDWCGADGDADGDTDADADSDTILTDWVGLPCQPAEGPDDDGYCADVSGDAEAFCFAWDGAPGGICTKQCAFATYDVPVDGCNMEGKVCMDISALTPDTADDAAGLGLCVEKCVPVSTGTPCKADYIACDPEAWSFEAQFDTCLMPKCQGDSDCLVGSGPSCTSDTDCLTENGEVCSTDGMCVFEGTCNTASGLCSWTGTTGAEIGDPCESSWDCPDNSLCLLPDTDPEGKEVRVNGYCVKPGCKAANTSSANGSGSPDTAIQARYGCGMVGTCHAGYPWGGFCFRRCTQAHDQAAFRCRQGTWDGDVLDIDGDYDCYDQTQFAYPIFAEGNATMYNVSPNPFCIFVSSWVGAKCGSGENEMTPADCTTYFGNNGANAQMTCRNLETGELDASGYCLDNTTSGPTGTWAAGDADTDADTDSDTDSGTEALPTMEPCEGGLADPASGLCWQDPPLAGPLNRNFAVDACAGLDHGGHDDWRLPAVHELISLLRGCVDGTATGDLSPSACAAADPGCLDSSCNTGCGACDYMGGPGDQPAGCYWDEILTGTCGACWSASPHATAAGIGWVVSFGLGFAHTEDDGTPALVRCVRDGP